jgi:hypothetical protein
MKLSLNDAAENLFYVGDVLANKKYGLLARPLIALALAFAAVHFINGFTEAKYVVIRQKIEAQKTEAEVSAKYLKSKGVFEKFKKELPPLADKDLWLFSYITSVLKNLNIKGVIGKQEIRNNGIFTIASLSVEANIKYDQLGRITEALENGEYYVRISDLLAVKNPATTDGIKVSLKLNTLFVNEGRKS